MIFVVVVVFFVVLQVMKCQNNLPLLELTQGLNPLDLFWSKKPLGFRFHFHIGDLCVCVQRESWACCVAPIRVRFSILLFFFLFFCFFPLSFFGTDKTSHWNPVLPCFNLLPLSFEPRGVHQHICVDRRTTLLKTLVGQPLEIHVNNLFFCK